MEIPANQARIEIALDGLPYPVIALRGDERLSQGFYFQLDIQTTPDVQVSRLIGRLVQLRLWGLEGSWRNLSGFVETAVDTGLNSSGSKQMTLGVSPRFRGLEWMQGPALWLGLDIRGLIKTLIDESSLSHVGEVLFDFNDEHPPRPWTLRAPGESSSELIARRMAHEGIFFRIDTREGVEQLIFTDHNARCPYVSGGAVRGFLQAGMHTSSDGRTQVGVFHVEEHRLSQPGAAIGYVLPPERPARPLSSDPRAAHRPGLEAWFENGCADLQSAQRWATLRDQYNDQLAHYLIIKANRVDLVAGHCITLESGPQRGDYLITAVKHQSSQAAGLDVAGKTVPYTCEATLIPRTRTFRTPFPPKRRLPQLIGAYIESDNPYATLDEQARYRARTLFEPGVLPHAHASIPLRKANPYGGRPNLQGQPVGWHAPLQDRQEVLLSCLNNDPEQLMVAGGYYDPSRGAPVISDNLTQNIYRSVSGNALIMEDQRAHEMIRLHARDGFLFLELNADVAGHWVHFGTTEGAVELKAKKTQHLTSGDTLTERSGNDRIHLVENRHATTTRQGKIHHQSALDAAIHAGEYVKIESGGDTRFVAGQHFRLEVEENASFTIEQGDAIVRVDEGEVHFQGAKSMEIKGQGGGPITFEQNGAGFRIDEQGNIDLFGKAISLGGPNGIEFKGEVHYEVPGSTPAAKPTVKPALTIPYISPLTDGEQVDPEAQTVDLLIEIDDEFMRTYDIHQPLLDGTGYRLATDTGEIRTGILQKQRIEETGVSLKRGYQIEFDEDMPL